MFVIYILSTATLSYLFFSYLSRKFKIDKFTFNIFFLLKFVYLLLYIYSHYNNFGTERTLDIIIKLKIIILIHFLYQKILFMG